MKKLVFLLLSIYMVVSCNKDDLFFEKQTEKIELPYTISNKLDANDICNQLLFEYRSSTLAKTAITLQQQIDLLDDIASKNNFFKELKSSDYTKITTIEAKLFLTHSDSSCNSLNVSKYVALYLDIILQTNYPISNLHSSIEGDISLTQTKKNTLHFLLDRIILNLNLDDPSWDKKNISGIVEGYQHSEAQAIFNAALITLYRE